MIEYLDFGSAVVTGWPDVEYIAFIPICVVNLIEPVGSGVEEVFGVHNIIKDGIDVNIGGEIDNFDVNHFEHSGIEDIEVLKIKFIILFWVDNLCSWELVLPEYSELL